MKRSQDHPAEARPAISGHSDQDSISSGHSDQDITTGGLAEVGVWEEREEEEEEEEEEGDTAHLVFKESVDSGIVVVAQNGLPLAGNEYTCSL